jgi:hypothetical protein
MWQDLCENVVLNVFVKKSNKKGWCRQPSDPASSAGLHCEDGDPVLSLLEPQMTNSTSMCVSDYIAGSFAVLPNLIFSSPSPGA